MAETAINLARKAAQHMQQLGIEQSRLDAELLLADVLGINRLELYMQFDRPITEAELEKFRGYVRRRLKREPVQYIVGQAAFRKMVLQVDRRVLIPRPETEQLVEQVIQWARARDVSSALDIGTGSGAIALSLATEASLRVVATDVSRDALALAQSNAERLTARVEFRCGATWSPIAADERFDIIVSNPPYIGEVERESLAPEVREWEPSNALFSGAAGLDVIGEIVRGAPRHLKAGGLLALEIGAAQASQVMALIESTKSYTDARVAQDLAGRDRIVLTELTG